MVTISSGFMSCLDVLIEARRFENALIVESKKTLMVS